MAVRSNFDLATCDLTREGRLFPFILAAHFGGEMILSLGYYLVAETFARQLGKGKEPSLDHVA
ncbi:uncharacterized protein BT62DRAFT_934570 [Guyanagaster necrorhizus]|uniref:Uncharacterized protein n=1 Tax=Guyanagaster necrorhizus TaxID=856835 RepID=A0A9P7VQ64_9AGAR|nr:uncharacterized protein BT62DRAFT_934570 [Guyanagaster necrorhizus MCA 3950]KAG7443984.1 hypothetical protein BT62DRAFT_934570 [Guyanagaster necrorhizus MCA 3950]